MLLSKFKQGKVSTLEAALQRISDGCSLMYGGFGGIGTPPTIVEGILNKGCKHLSLIGNDAGFPDVGVGRLISSGRVKKLITSHIGSNPIAGQLMNKGEMDVTFSPQGTLIERIRAGGMGLGGILSDVGLATVVEEGKPHITVNGQEYLIETALTAEVSIIHASKADHLGNLVFDKSARNFNPLVAMAGDFTIVEADEIVQVGELDPESIITPGIFVDMVIPSEGVNWKWVWE